MCSFKGIFVQMIEVRFEYHQHSFLINQVLHSIIKINSSVRQTRSDQDKHGNLSMMRHCELNPEDDSCLFPFGVTVLPTRRKPFLN